MPRANKSSMRLWEPPRSAAAGATTRSEATDNPALQAIWHAVCAIPRGQVSTYGAVARSAGFPGRARQAGFALKVSPKELYLPWHRVVGAGGRIVFPKASRAYQEQARRLRAEGVSIKNGRVMLFAMTHIKEL